ncbi:hypothetical protein FOYG_08814 [Fusarium oxysporum NRRL 32931]|uniref:Uncharacterized protein n=1 Tax=Fusarium oxysporum NRRL 32931 TaxID=660029 RepID=W9IGA0_FUSOX|nr:hypothetical protein FOYG_08814 [Fusarium oxysporum NRRL 32931]
MPLLVILSSIPMRMPPQLGFVHAGYSDGENTDRLCQDADEYQPVVGGAALQIVKSCRLFSDFAEVESTVSLYLFTYLINLVQSFESWACPLRASARNGVNVYRLVA